MKKANTTLRVQTEGKMKTRTICYFFKVITETKTNRMKIVVLMHFIYLLSFWKKNNNITIKTTERDLNGFLTHTSTYTYTNDIKIEFN